MPSPLPGIAFGGDYNPEQWPGRRVEEDVALMRRGRGQPGHRRGLLLGPVEPCPAGPTSAGSTRCIDLLHAAGIAVDLATATASPPPWFSRRPPGDPAVPRDGTRCGRAAGRRTVRAPRSFPEHACGRARALAERYGGHPALTMWHVPNEWGCQTSRATATFAPAFRTWLVERYGDPRRAQRGLGHRLLEPALHDIDEVMPPRSRPLPQPHPALDFRRFFSDALMASFLRRRRRAARAVTPSVPVTTNFMVMHQFRDLDYPAWAPQSTWSARHYLTAVRTPRAELAFART